MHSLHASEEDACPAVDTQHSIHIHHGRLPRTLQQEASLLDWSHAADTLCPLFLAFASSHRDSDILANTYIITLVLIAVLTVKTCATKVYRNVHMNTLELSSLLNLVILSATVYYLKGKGNSADIACKCTSASVSFGAIIFIGISFYHTYLRIRKMKCYELVKQNILAKFIQCDREIPVHKEGRHNAKMMPTTSIIELREELLAGTSGDEGTLDM